MNTDYKLVHLYTPPKDKILKVKDKDNNIFMAKFNGEYFTKNNRILINQPIYWKESENKDVSN